MTDFTSTLNDLKRARQWYFAFFLKVTLRISIIKRNLWILKASAFLNKFLNSLALLLIAALQTKGLSKADNRVLKIRSES